MSRFFLYRTSKYKPFLFLFGVFSFIWVTCLLCAGGITTSLHAGMAFLDWPLSNGSLNPSGWLEAEDQIAEHSHRLLGMKVGFLSIIMVVSLYVREARCWVRRLGLAILICVIFQGVLGGARVLLDPLNSMQSIWVSRSFAILHAFGAQAIVCLWLTLILALSRHFNNLNTSYKAHTSTGYWGLTACGVIAVQILLGAIMRHIDAGLAIPTFPKTPQHTWVPLDWNFSIAIHFAHRIWAVVTSFAVVLFLVVAGYSGFLQRWRLFWGVFALFTLFSQVFLGALVIFSIKNPYIATLHMLFGALLLACVWGLTFTNFHKNACYYFKHT